MKGILVVVVLLALVVGYYQACAIPAAREDERQQARDRETLQAIAAQESTAAALERLRDSLRRDYLARDRVRADSLTVLELRLGMLQDSSAGLVTRLDSLLDHLPDSARAVVSATVRALGTELAVCRTALGLQRDRLTDCQQTEARADSLVREARLNLTAAKDSALALAQRWRAQAERNDRLLWLGPYVGGGLTAAGGQVYAGPQVGFGLQLRWVPIPPW